MHIQVMNKYMEHMLLKARETYRGPLPRVTCSFCKADAREVNFRHYWPIPLGIITKDAMIAGGCDKCPLKNYFPDSEQWEEVRSCVAFGRALLEAWEGFFDEEIR